MFKFITDLFKPGTDLAQLIQQGAIIVDVRSSAEFDAGHAKGSTNIPLDRIRMAAAALKKLNRPVITVCRTGNRSSVGRSMLAAAGIVTYNGGAWTNLK
jgi:phage shock protein E